MKKLLTLMTTLIVGFVLTPFQAEAQSYKGKVIHSKTYVSGHASCGCKVHSKKVFKGYSYGKPVYSYYRQPIYHTCKRYGKTSHHGKVHSSVKYNYKPKYNYSNSYSRGYSGRSHRGSYGHSGKSYRSSYGYSGRSHRGSYGHSGRSYRGSYKYSSYRR